MSLEAMMAKLRREYAPFVKTAFSEIETAFERGEARPELWRRAHRLAGTAGSYGFADVGRAARMLEEQLEQPAASLEEAREGLRRAVAAIE